MVQSKQRREEEPGEKSFSVKEIYKPGIQERNKKTCMTDVFLGMLLLSMAVFVVHMSFEENSHEEQIIEIISLTAGSDHDRGD